MRNCKLVTLAILIASVNVFGAPIVDGFFDLSEGYTSGNYLNFALEGGGYLEDQGQLWTWQDSSSYDVYVALVLPKSVVDNSYGDNSIGWNEMKGKGNPNSYGHKFNDLLVSDKAIFDVKDSQGFTVIDFALDYIAIDPYSSSGYSSMGITGSGGITSRADGMVIAGDGDALSEWGTSLDYNLNELGYALTSDSPYADENYENVDPLYADWVYDVIYEFKIDGSYFDGMGFSIDGLEAHVSPLKTSNVISTPEIGDDISVPLPSTILLFGPGAAFLRFFARKKR